MTLKAPLLTTALFLIAAVPAIAQQAPHPLEAALTRQLRTAQFRASGRCIETRAALHHALAAGLVDTDEDGQGELATMPELLGLVPWRGRDDETAGAMTWPGARVVAPGVVEADGYLYRVELPNAAFEPAPTLSAVDADASERGVGQILAWPSRYGLTGRFTFAMDLDAGEAVLANAAAYSGVDAPPRLGAALIASETTPPRGDLRTPLIGEGVGRDGQLWLPRSDERVSVLTSDVEIPNALSLAPIGTDGKDERARVLREMFALVRDATAASDDAGPPRLVITDHSGMHAALVAELQPLFERFGGWEKAQQALPLVALALPAKYVAEEHVILFAPRSLEIAAFLAEIPPERLFAAFKAILLHESVHALDRNRHAQDASLAACKGEGDLLCWSAMSEGHAQQVARRVCAAAGLDEGFADMVRLIHDDDAHRAAPEALRAALVSLSFPYVKGERFLDAVLERGGAGAVVAVLRTPPTRPAEIERPALWFARAERVGPDLLAILALLRPLDPEGATVQETPILRASLAIMLAVGAGVDAESVANGIEDGQTRVAAGETGASQTVTTVLRCRDAAAAEAYAKASLAFQRAQDAQYADNPLLRIETRYERVQGGYTNTRTIRTASGTIGGAVMCISAGRFVIEATLSRQAAGSLALTERLDTIVRAAAKSASPLGTPPRDE